MTRPDIHTKQKEETVQPRSTSVPGDLLDYGFFVATKQQAIRRGFFAKAEERSAVSRRSHSLLAKAKQLGKNYTTHGLLARAKQQSEKFIAHELPEELEETEITLDTLPEELEEIEIAPDTLPETGESAQETAFEVSIKAPPETVPASPDATQAPVAETAPPQEAAQEVIPSVKFPIGVKLAAIIFISLLVSMGIITTLVSVLLSADVRITAEDNNYSINRRLSSGINNSLKSIYSKAALLLNSLTLMPMDEQTLAYFFEQNPEIEAVGVGSETRSSGGSPAFFFNQRFFAERASKNATAGNTTSANPATDHSLLVSWFTAHDEERERAVAGELLLRNASPALDSTDLALFFSWGEDSAVCFFSTNNLLEGSMSNLSFLINENGDVLAHPNKAVVGQNLRQDSFVKTVIETETRSLQTQYTDFDGNEYLGAFQRVTTGNAVVITTISMQQVLRGVTTVTWRNILLTVGVLAISIVFILLFSRTISKPLKALTGAVGQIEDGNYHLELVNKNHDEIGVLISSVISMSHGLGNFERFTNKSLARLARTSKLVTGGVTKQATIFFSDIRGFTAISEKLKAVEVIGFINDYMERMVKCVLLTGGTIDKFIGDAVMAHWGAVETTGSPEEDALNCVKAALMMRAALRSFNRGRGTVDKPIIKIGCGVNSGDVVAGQIGSEERMEYTVIGDAVSFADRTETLNKAFGTDIMISEHTWKLCGYYLITEEMPTVTEAGEKVRMFAVVNVRDSEDAKEMLKDLATIPKTDTRLCRQCIGPLGPQSVADVRTLLNIPTPDLSNVNVDEEEKKYKVQENKNAAP